VFAGVPFFFFVFDLKRFGIGLPNVQAWGTCSPAAASQIHPRLKPGGAAPLMAFPPMGDEARGAERHNRIRDQASPSERCFTKKSIKGRHVAGWWIPSVPQIFCAGRPARRRRNDTVLTMARARCGAFRGAVGAGLSYRG